ncbi:MAG: complex I NDUFA9 subunit family protein [Xanthomonadales bacterium]|nr:complex I NDUFA9 subunit family protein [Xanthomonadales bacterium]
MKIVILGGTGFVGSHLVARLSTLGHSVDVLSRNADAKPQLAVLPRVRVRAANPYDSASLSAALQGADAVINLVGILNEAGFGGAGFKRAHVELTRCVIDACKAAGVRRLLQMSALNAGRGESHYLKTRGEAEALVKASGLDWTIYQPSVIFGPGDGLFSRFKFLLSFSPVLPLARAGAKFAPVYVGDVVAAMVQTLDDSSAHQQSYELYGPEVMTLAEIVRYTARGMHLKRLVIPLPDVLGRLQALAMDFVPGKPFSTDNFLSLKTDSVGGIDGLYRLKIEKTPVAAVIPQILFPLGKQSRLDRYRGASGRP